jgi:hypothetical protein
VLQVIQLNIRINLELQILIKNQIFKQNKKIAMEVIQIYILKIKIQIQMLTKIYSKN